MTVIHDNTPPPGRLLLPGEASAMLRVDIRTLARWADSGQLDCIRTPTGLRRYREAEILELLGYDGTAGNAPAKLRSGGRPVALHGTPVLDRDAAGCALIELGHTGTGEPVMLEVTSHDWLIELIVAARCGYTDGDIPATTLAMAK